jgi:excisionase family DNA binding protein
VNPKPDGLAPMAFSRPDAAKLLSVSEQHLRRLLNQGLIRGVRLGARIVIPRAELERVLNLDNSAERD